MEGHPDEGALRGGHVPGALSIPWARAVDREDGTFGSAAELDHLYCRENGLRAKDDIIVYCRIGERSSHLVRTDLSARLRERPELRRQPDRLGQPRRCSRRALSPESIHVFIAAPTG